NELQRTIASRRTVYPNLRLRVPANDVLYRSSALNGSHQRRAGMMGGAFRQDQVWAVGEMPGALGMTAAGADRLGSPIRGVVGSEGTRHALTQWDPGTGGLGAS